VLVTISLEGTPSSDEVRHLAAELGLDDALRGRVSLDERAPEPDALGTVLEGLRIIAEPGLAGAIVGAVVTWLRYRTTDLTANVTRSGEEVTVKLSAKRLRRMSSAELNAFVDAVSSQLRGTAPASPGEPPDTLRDES